MKTAPRQPILAILLTLTLCGAVWFTGVKPLIGEIEHFKYKQALVSGKIPEAQKHIRKALQFDPHNTSYLLYLGQLLLNVQRTGEAIEYITESTIRYNGDITRWSAYFLKGLLHFQMGALKEAKRAFEVALYYNPEFTPATQKLAEVEKVLSEHDKVLIPIR